MKKSISRVLTLLLACAMLLCLVPMAASADGDAYAVLGVQNGDRIILNPGIDGYTDFEHKVTIVDADQAADMDQSITMTAEHFTLEPTATGIDSVVFAIDGTTVATDDEAPYEFALDASHKGQHTLTATINKTEGGTEEKTVGFTGIVGEFHDLRLVNYDSGKLDATNTPTFNGAVSRGEKIVNGALQIESLNGISAMWLQPDVQTNEMKLGDTKLFYIDFDVYRSSDDTQLAFRTSRDFRPLNLGSTGTIATAMPAGEWVHMTIVADYERGWFSAYMNGVQFKSWYQSAMLDSTSDLVTDSIATYIDAGPGRTVRFDNYAARTYEVATNEAKSITLTGLTEGEEIAINQASAPVTYRTLGIAGDTGSVYKVDYKVDGEVVATATASPFTWDMPFTDVGVSHTVSAVAYTAASQIETADVSYKTVFMDIMAVRGSNDFETAVDNDGTDSFGFSVTARNTDTFTLADASALGRDGKVLFFDRTGTHANPSRVYTKESFTFTKAIFKFDIYVPNGTVADGNVCVWSTGVGVADGTVLFNLSSLETGKWYPVSIITDSVSKKITYTVGDKIYAMDMPAALAQDLDPTNTGKRARVAINSFTDYYLDNYYVAALQNGAGRTDAFLNGYNYVADANGVDVTASYINMTNEAVDVNVYFALYNGNTLVKAWAEPVTVGAKGFARVNKNISYAQAKGTGTTVKAFCWSPDLQPIEVNR